MAFDPVLVGTTANDGTGDPLRTAFTRVNSNFGLAVEGPATATSGRVAVYDGATGKLLQDGTKVEADLVVGPASVTAGSVAAFNGTTGKLVQQGLGAGTATAPSLAFAADSNTGLFNPSADTLAASTNGVERMRITSAGDVGIGTTSTTTKLTISSPSGLAGGISIFETSTGNSGRVFFYQGNGFAVINATQSSATNDLRFQTGSADRMSITSAGNVGIGATSPANLLEVRSTSAGANVFLARFRNAGTTTGTESSLLLTTNTSSIGDGVSSSVSSVALNATGDTALLLKTAAGGTAPNERMRITSAGNVGIGTTAPSATLETRSNDTTIAIFRSQNASNTGEITIRSQGGVGNNTRGRVLGGYEAGGADFGGFLAFRTTSQSNVNTERMRITSAGNVGIGTDAPTHFLDVNSNTIRIRTAQTPASNGTGTQGQIAWDADYIYVCTATNTWKRVALTGGY